MASVHETVNWTAGDAWQINATLVDDTGTPFNLSGSPPIKWALLTEAGQTVLDETDATVVIIDGVNGKCAIQIPAAKTSPLPGGRYSDMIRIIFGGIPSTLSYGLIDVAANPWVT